MLWVPALVLFQGLFNVVLFRANRRKDYAWTSVGTVGRSVGMVTVQVVLGLADRGAMGLLVGRMFGMVLATVILGVQTLRNEWRSVMRSFDFARTRELAREHDQFPKYNAPREGIVAVSGSVPTFFLAILFSPAAAGLYWFTVRLLEVPTTLIGISVRRVFFERATRAFREGERIYPLLVKATAVLAALGIVPALAIFIVGPALFDGVDSVVVHALPAMGNLGVEHEDPIGRVLQIPRGRCSRVPRRLRSVADRRAETAELVGVSSPNPQPPYMASDHRSRGLSVGGRAGVGPTRS